MTTFDTSICRKDSQMSFAEAFPASHSALPAPGSDTAKRMTVSSGLRCFALCSKSSQVGLLARMLLASNQWASSRWFLTWRPAGTKSGRLKFRLVPSDTITGARASGFAHTPTATANQGAPSMQKYPGARGLEMTPQAWERRMGFPEGWTDIE